MEIIDLENDYFLIRFEDWTDAVRVFEGGPWMILGHCLVVQRWHPEFFPREDELKRVAVWIRVPGLPIEYYDKNILWNIGNCIGRTVKIDSNTLKFKKGMEADFYVPERGKFARICVEVDLRKILRSKFVLNKRTYAVEYEGLNLVCFSCGRYGHRKEQCMVKEGDTNKGKENAVTMAQEKENNPVAQKSENFGPWMLVQRNGGRRRQQVRPAPENQRERINYEDNSMQNGSRFGALSNYEENPNNNDALIDDRFDHNNISNTPQPHHE
ncbi:hypothetical protein A2U01_0014960, partial [Trifolium medium]|nr:hypothetical protein [Trifolium medium]